MSSPLRYIQKAAAAGGIKKLIDSLTEGAKIFEAYVWDTANYTDASITPAKLDFGLIGAVVPFPITTAPTGWLAANGAAVSRTTYADLFAVIGTVWGVGDGSTTFNVPDLRGAFLRGTGSHGSETMANSSAFAGPAVGSYEDDQMQGHYHESRLASGVGSVNSLAARGDTSTANSTAQVLGPASDGTNGTPRTGDETRPFAAGILYCIKY